MVINMNNKKWIIIIIILIILIGGGIFVFISNKNSYDSNNTNNDNNTSDSNTTYEANRTSANSDNSQNNTNSNTSNTNDNSVNQNTNTFENTNTNPPVVKEEQIATFSTKIYDNDSARQNNINITCNTLNGTTVKNGATFSFCNTVGQASSSKGYQKANIFDNNGKKKKGLGGGNCQISTTLYNAVLSVPGLVVTERHNHSNKVPYITTGKDAAVAYGSYDFKFRNNSGNDIKINCSSDKKNVSVTLLSIKYQ